jgi:hypothetical protein
MHDKLDKVTSTLNFDSIFKFGSFTYGTQRKGSDHDYILVLADGEPYPDYGSLIDEGNITIHIFTKVDFDAAVDAHDVRAIECIYLDSDRNYGPIDIDLGKLRKSFSTVANGAWVKGNKKLTVSADYDKVLAIKSIFHAIRIFDFGIQIIRHGDIVEPARYKWLLEELYILADKHERNELWEVIHARYHTLFKDKYSEFKSLAPKSGDYSTPGSVNKDELLAWIDKRIRKREKDKLDADNLHHEISIGGQLTGMKQLRQYISLHLKSE